MQLTKIYRSALTLFSDGTKQTPARGTMPPQGDASGHTHSLGAGWVWSQASRPLLQDPGAPDSHGFLFFQFLLSAASSYSQTGHRQQHLSGSRRQASGTPVLGPSYPQTTGLQFKGITCPRCAWPCNSSSTHTHWLLNWVSPALRILGQRRSFCLQMLRLSVRGKYVNN